MQYSFFPLSSFLSLLSLVSYIALVSDLIQKQQQSNKQTYFFFPPYSFLLLSGLELSNFFLLAVSLSVSVFIFRHRRLRRFYRPPYSRLLTKKLKTNKTTLKTVLLNYYKDR